MNIARKSKVTGMRKTANSFYKKKAEEFMATKKSIEKFYKELKTGQYYRIGNKKHPEGVDLIIAKGKTSRGELFVVVEYLDQDDFETLWVSEITDEIKKTQKITKKEAYEILEYLETKI